jgi:hypothetical protein
MEINRHVLKVYADLDAGDISAFDPHTLVDFIRSVHKYFHLAPIDAEIKQLEAKLSENHDWQCGCGHWNGPNLADCPACGRAASVTADELRKANAQD